MLGHEVQEVKKALVVEVVQEVLVLGSQEVQVVEVVQVSTVVQGAQQVQEVQECVPHGLVRLYEVVGRLFEKNRVSHVPLLHCLFFRCQGIW